MATPPAPRSPGTPRSGANFTDLSDSGAGPASSIPAIEEVDSRLTALEASQSVVVVPGTSYTLLASDVCKRVEFTAAQGCNLTIPANVFFASDKIDLLTTAGNVTFTPADGVTLNSAPVPVVGLDAGLAIIVPWAMATLICRGDNVFVIVGRLEAYSAN